MLREVQVTEVTKAIQEMCIAANKTLPEDLIRCIRQCGQKETNPVALGIFDDMLANIEAAEELNIPVCQDTGMAVIFMDVGQDVHFIGGSLEEAVQEGVRQGYTQGYLRCSVVTDPLERVNTGDNTPAILHTRIVEGDNITLTVAPKGFGSENMSAVKMFTPAATRENLIQFVCEVARKAGSNPCPPMVLGVGIGGDFEYAAVLAKKALCRRIDQRNPKPFYEKLEHDMLEAVNQLQIGPQGFGGDVTALVCNIEEFPTHIAGLPVAVNVGCHVTRHVTRVL